jgi:VanZ like family/Concanavalin A-like lectin/glucanases superfamily
MKGRHAMPEHDDMTRLRTRCALVTIIAGVLFATLWPFDPFPSNQVSWLPNANGVRFGSHGVIVSKSPLAASMTSAGESCSLELFLSPEETARSYTILNFYVPENPGQFRVRQWTDGLLVTRNFRDSRGRHKLRGVKFDVDHAFEPGKLVLLTITSGAGGTTVYLDGRKAQVFPRFSILRSDLAGEIVIGTSAVDYQTWPGEVRGLAIYSKELLPEDVLRHYETWTTGDAGPPDLDGAVSRYAFTEKAGREIHNSVATGPELVIPSTFRIPHKAFLRSPIREFEVTGRYLSDVLLNIVGFVPVGFLLCAFFALSRPRKNAFLYAVLAGGMLSLAIEVMQAYIPQRVSGVTDIITNTLGSALGAWLAQPNFIRAVLRTESREK